MDNLKTKEAASSFNTAENIDYEKTSPVRAGANYWVSTQDYEPTNQLLQLHLQRRRAPYNVVWCSVVQCIAVQCNAMPCHATQSQLSTSALIMPVPAPISHSCGNTYTYAYISSSTINSDSGSVCANDCGANSALSRMSLRRANSKFLIIFLP